MNGSRQRSWRRWFAFTSLTLACWIGQSSQTDIVRADDVSSRYYDQLRSRRLFSLAEGDCLARLLEAKLSPSRRARQTIQLARTFTEHATYTVGQEQGELWRRAVEVVEKLWRDDPQNPLRLLLETERALIPATQGAFLRWQVELFPHDVRLGKRARAAFDDSLPRLQDLEKVLARRVRAKSRRRSLKAETLSPYELRSLWYSVRYQLGATLVERAKLDPAGSDDRTATLLEAEDWLEPLPKSALGTMRSFNSRLLLAEVSRLRGDRKKAAGLLNALEAESLPLQIIARLTAQRAHLYLDADRPTDAAQLLSKYRTNRLRLPGELRFLQVKALGRLWKIAEENDKTELTGKLLEQIEAHVRQAENEIGGYWAYRCGLLLEFTRQSQKYGSELAATVRKAGSLYAGGQSTAAIDEYAEAIAAALQSGKSEIAMELGYTRASIQLQSGEVVEAGESFHELVERFPSSDRAASAHLLWAYCLGRLYDENRTRSRRERYTAALGAHRENYAEHPTAVEATWMLAVLEESRLQVTRALKLYLEIPDGERRAPSAQVAVARCYEQILGRVRELRLKAETWENDAIHRLDRIASTYPREPQPLSLQQSEVFLRFARICLNFNRPDYEKAGRLLDRMTESWAQMKQQLESNEDEPRKRISTDWKPLLQAATQLRIVALAGRGSVRQAEALIRNLSETSSTDVLSILDGLTRLVSDSDDITRRRLGELQLQTAIELNHRRSELPIAERRRLDRCLAQAYVATGQPSRAIEVYESLLAEAPKHETRRLLKRVSELLIHCGTSECFQKAKQSWRKLESFETPGSSPWLTARYHVALCCYSLRQDKECRKLLAVTRLLYPKLGGDELCKKFTKLERDLKIR